MRSNAKPYKPEDFERVQGVVDVAKTMWRDQCQKYMDKNGDAGSCVIGAGISVWFILKGKRKPTERMIINVWDVCNAQGSLVWENSVKDIVKYLQDNGVDCWYNAGNMD